MGILILTLAGGAVGLLFLLAGSRLLGFTLAILGALLGGIVGAAVAELLLPGAPAWVLIGGMAAVMAVVGALSGRLVAAVALACILGVAGVLAVGSADRHGWIDFASPTARPGEKAGEATQDERSPAASDTPAREGTIAALRANVASRLQDLAAPLRPTAAEERLGALDALFAEARTTFTSRWEASSRPVRTLTLACGAACAFLGLCFGVLAPRWTAAFVSAVLGASLVLMAVAVGLPQLGGVETMPGSRRTWMIVWTALAMGGTAVQWWSGRRRHPA